MCGLNAHSCLTFCGFSRAQLYCRYDPYQPRSLCVTLNTAPGYECTAAIDGHGVGSFHLNGVDAASNTLLVVTDTRQERIHPLHAGIQESCPFAV